MPSDQVLRGWVLLSDGDRWQPVMVLSSQTITGSTGTPRAAVLAAQAPEQA